MNLVERDVEGFSCGTILAPKDWILRVYHDISSLSSVNVAHFKKLDNSGNSMYVAEHFLSHEEKNNISLFQEEIEKRLIKSSLINMKNQCSPLSITWEVDKLDKSSFSESNSLIPLLIDNFKILISVVLYIADMNSTDVNEIFEKIVLNLKNRYRVSLKEKINKNLISLSNISGVYSPRGNCIIQVYQKTNSIIQWNPNSDNSLDWLNNIVTNELELASENLRLSISESFSTLVVLFPLPLGVSLMNRSVILRVWCNYIRQKGWNCVELIQNNISVSNNLEMSCSVTPFSAFYLLSNNNNNNNAKVIACIMAPRVGSDSCVVLLIPALTLKEEKKEEEDISNEIDNSNIKIYETQCNLILSTFHISITNTTSWTSLCLGKEAGFLFRQGNLVVHLPSVNTSYVNATTNAVGAFSIISLGSITIKAEDNSNNYDINKDKYQQQEKQKRWVTVTLLNEYRSSEDYLDYIITEYLYDTPLKKDAAIFRRRKKEKKHIISSILKPKMHKSEESSMWIKLGERGAVYYEVCEYGTGYLLLTQSCVLDSNIDEVTAEHWEMWISGIGVAAIV